MTKIHIRILDRFLCIPHFFSAIPYEIRINLYAWRHWYICQPLLKFFLDNQEWILGSGVSGHRNIIIDRPRNRTRVFHASTIQHIRRDGKWCHYSIQMPCFTSSHQERATLQYSDQLALLPFILLIPLLCSQALRGSRSRCDFVPHEDTHIDLILHEGCVS